MGEVPLIPFGQEGEVRFSLGKGPVEFIRLAHGVLSSLFPAVDTFFALLTHRLLPLGFPDWIGVGQDHRGIKQHYYSMRGFGTFPPSASAERLTRRATSFDLTKEWRNGFLTRQPQFYRERSDTLMTSLMPV